jgi:hypothetical protein
MTRTKIIALTLLVLTALALIGYHAYALWRFEQAYEDYARAASAHDEAAIIPMLPENPLRRDLNAALSDVLTGEIAPESRVARAREGLSLLVLSEGNIDAVGEVGKDVTEAILTMEDRAGFALLVAQAPASRLIELAHRRASVVGDIRGLSYRANHHTKEIFDQLVADDGEMTAEHASQLEKLLPEVEEQFDRRSNLSIELQALAGQVSTAFAEFDASW